MQRTFQTTDEWYKERFAKGEQVMNSWTGQPYPHGEANTYKRGCRCDPCRASKRIETMANRRARGIQPLKRGPQTDHGTVARYANGCRCDGCKEANRQRSIRMRDKAKAEGFVNQKHGRLTTYQWGCRCEECTEVGRTHYREYQRRRRAS